MGLSQPVKGWFSTPGRPGDRTLDQQLKGLDLLFAKVQHKTVLDLGCAEGLISMELARAGALAVHGVEIVPEHVAVAKKLQGSAPICFEVGDANTWKPTRQYDIVIALALLHKLRDPTEACYRLCGAAKHLVVLRLPPLHAPTIVDPRSGNNPHHIGRVMEKQGFELEFTARGHLDEWVGYYVRKEPLSV